MKNEQLSDDFGVDNPFSAPTPSPILIASYLLPKMSASGEGVQEPPVLSENVFNKKCYCCTSVGAFFFNPTWAIICRSTCLEFFCDGVCVLGREQTASVRGRGEFGAAGGLLQPARGFGERETCCRYPQGDHGGEEREGRRGEGGGAGVLVYY